jgi:hypothetical protein
MGGGLLQLYTRGPQDKFLTGNPTITFFKKVYRKHTNLAVEQMVQMFTGTKSFGNRLRCKIEKKGDLLKDMYLLIKIKNGDAPAVKQEDNYKNIMKCGFAIIEYVEIEIGGQIIDKHYGEWLDIWTQLTMTNEKYDLLRNLIRDRRNKFDLWQGSWNEEDRYIYVPLFFWFNQDPGLALPLIALQYHDVVLYVKLKKKEEIKVVYETDNVKNNNTSLFMAVSNSTNSKYDLLPVLASNNEVDNAIAYKNTYDPCIITNVDKTKYQSFLINPSVEDDISIKNNKWYIENFTGEIEDIVCLCDYIFIDSDERKKFANNSHEYLITQVQTGNRLDLDKLTQTTTNRNKQIELDFNHPVKEIFWTISSEHLKNTLIHKNMDFSNTMSTCLLQVNGNDRIPGFREGYFFSNVIPFQYHTCGGLIPSDNNHFFTGGMYCFPFCINPENYQPSGSLNFSQVNDFTINFNYRKTDNRYSTLDEYYTFNSYAINYNILKINNGMGGLAYTN